MNVTGQSRKNSFLWGWGQQPSHSSVYLLVRMMAQMYNCMAKWMIYNMGSMMAFHLSRVPIGPKLWGAKAACLQLWELALARGK